MELVTLYIEKYVKNNIDELIKKYRTSNMSDIIYSNKNICIFPCKLNKNLNGYYQYISVKKQIIVINSNLDEHSRQSALFHEFGHYSLKHKGKMLLNRTFGKYTKEEYEADMFSAYMFLIHNHIDSENIKSIILPDRMMKLIYKFL